MLSKTHVPTGQNRTRLMPWGTVRSEWISSLLEGVLVVA